MQQADIFFSHISAYLTSLCTQWHATTG